MDIEQMKQLWNKLDETINQQQTINTELVMHIIKDRNRRTVNKISGAEYLGIAVAVVVLMVFLVMLPRLGNAPLLVVSYVICMLIMITTIVTGIYKTRYIADENYSHRSVVDATERMEKFRLFIAREKIVALATGPVIIATFTAVVFQLVRGINIFEDITTYLPRIIAGTIAYCILAVILYKQIYFRSIKEIKNNMDEITRLKNK